MKKYLEIYHFGHPASHWAEFHMFGDYFLKCGTFNSNIIKDSIIDLLIFIVIGLVIYLLKLI
tara:strand:- start:485 stop:670 length:186 start_codon:yes stop_codon:yes gene_type:complete